MQRNEILVIVGCSVAVAILSVVAIVGFRFARHRAAEVGPQVAATDIGGEADDEAAVKAAQPIDPAMITYHETAGFSVAFREPRALAVDGENQIYVGGDRAVACFSGEGQKLAEIALLGEPRCLAVGVLERPDTARTPDTSSPGPLLYVAMEDHVEVYTPTGTRLAAWASRQDAVFTSIATTEKEVWVADAGNRLVWRFDADGHLLAPVGRPDPVLQRPGFLVTNHYFDLAANTDGLVYVVNPRLLHVEGFMQSGERETTWGKGSPAVEDFFGCCNPAQLAVLPDGRFVTAEKGIPRVKIYSRRGEFQTVVAGPAQLTETPADLAADHQGRVLVLDGRAAKVRVFEKNAGNEKNAGKKENKP